MLCGVHRLTALPIVALSLLALVGCSSASSNSAPSTSANAAAAADIARSFDTVTELRDAYTKAGGNCPEWNPSNNVTLAKQSGDCNDSTVLMVFDSAAQKDAAVTNLNTFASSDNPSLLLVGPNWIVNAPDARNVSAGLGGKVVTSTGTDDTETADDTSTASSFETTPDEWVVTLKTRSKECFGSAGCNLTLRPSFSYAGLGDLPEEGTVDITYEVTGIENGPQVQSETFEDGSASISDISVQTTSSSKKPKAKVTDVTYTP